MKIWNLIVNLYRRLNGTDVIHWAIVILGVIAIFYIVREKNTVTIPDTISMKPTTVYIDKNGDKRSEIQALTLDRDNFKTQTDSLKKVLKGRASIREVVKYETRIDTYFHTKVTGDTSTGYFYTRKQDDYIDIEVEGNIKTNNGIIKVGLKDTITHIDYVQKRFFRSNLRKVNLSSKSPYLTITQGSAIVLKEPKPILVIGPQIGYNPIGKHLTYGIGVTIPVISIKTRK